MDAIADKILNLQATGLSSDIIYSIPDIPETEKEVQNLKEYNCFCHQGVLHPCILYHKVHVSLL